MRRRLTWRGRALAALVGVMAVGIAPVLGPGGVASTRTQSAEPPNIVLILTDDQDFRSLAEMPHVGALLSEQGTTFPNFIFSTPSCCPSRASILRGQYTHNHGVLRSKPPNGGESTFRELGREDSTVATWLQDAGYRTALVGKYLNGYGEDDRTTRVPPGWSDWYASTTIKYFDYTLVENGTRVEYGEEPEDYLTDVLSRKAQGIVEDAAAADAPLFMLLAARAPHGPATPAPRHLDAFAAAQAPRSPAYNERDVADKPAFVRDAPRLDGATRRQLDALYRDRMRTLLAVDEMVRDLVETLRATGELDNTYLLFTTDNGYALGEHRWIEKGLAYEESIRMPLLVRGPGIAAGVVDERLVSNIDLAPTFAELAGVEPPPFVDGRSLVPLLRGERPPAWRDATLVATFERRPERRREKAIDPTKNPRFEALRTADRLYVEYATGERELYDLRADPNQLENLAGEGTPQRRAELRRLAGWLVELQTCEAAGCRAAERDPAARTSTDVGNGPIAAAAATPTRAEEERRERRARRRSRPSAASPVPAAASPMPAAGTPPAGDSPPGRPFLGRKPQSAGSANLV